MNAIEHFHDVLVTTPFYAKEAGAQLHRFLVPEFIQRFERDLDSQQLNSDDATQWQTEDRFSRHDSSLVLRLPMHKTFYLVSCELVCQRLGQPALDVSRITSAGFVIRRWNDEKELSWMVQDDEAHGWQESSTGLKDPDVHRHMCRDGSLHPRLNISTYTGELTHPLHPKSTHDQNGKRRTILFGYLPLGGSMIRRQVIESAFDTNSLSDFSDAAKQHLPWPYGQREPLNTRWQQVFVRPVTQGRPSTQFFELLRLLVNRYHLGENGIDDNEALTELAQSLYFYQDDSTIYATFSDATRHDYNNLRKYSLYSWLNYHFQRSDNRIVAWMSQQEKKIEDAGGLQGSFTFDKLPAKNSSGVSSYSLYNTPSDARAFRTALAQRVIDNAESLAKEIPIPKFQQGVDDLYQVVPFVRAKDDHGKERIYWADSSTRTQKFRVAAPFDANASRPSVIQMPSLADLKSGLAKGASMITPPDTFNLLNALNLKKGASEDVLPEDEPSGIGIQWICSFSLPVIMLVAMILLMIMISLLNIIFFWLPWVKICLPFPKVK